MIILPLAFTLGFGLAASLAPAPGALPDLEAPVSLQVNRLTPAGTPMMGAEFEVRQVAYLGDERLDLASPIGWKQAAMNAQQNTNLAELTHLRSVRFSPRTMRGTTDAHGIVKFDEMAFGLYLVSEVSTPSDYLPTSPFWITLPQTHPKGTYWVYDLVVQPKSTSANSEIGAPPQSVPQRPYLTLTGIGLPKLIGAATLATAALALFIRVWKRNAKN